MFQIDLGQGIKPPGYYIQRSGGLFPAPLPQDHSKVSRVERLFFFFGTLLAKCLQDKRLIDMPLSRPFLKLLCMGEVGHHITQQYTESLHRSVGSSESYHSDHSDLMTSSIEDKELILDPPKFRHPDTPAWFSGILTEDDFDVVDPYRSNFLKQLRELVSRKQRILKDRSLTQDQKNIRLQRLALHGQKYEGCRIEDLG